MNKTITSSQTNLCESISYEEPGEREEVFVSLDLGFGNNTLGLVRGEEGDTERGGFEGGEDEGDTGLVLGAGFDAAGALVVEGGAAAPGGLVVLH